MCDSQLEKCMETIINIYHQYSIRVDHYDMLSKGELIQLINKELCKTLKNVKDPKKVESLMQEYDKDKNGQLDFGEFMRFLSWVFCLAHENIHQREGQAPGQGHGHSHGPGQGHGHSH
ncbi:protein S100-A12-like [Heteronotia binoei]|uniref:protein S100-A12-like n=1 Tax=Heteronotia binoei TaxID=13085 RepID=UPI00292D58D5|nr:protein S100-A12-like [Heteronotia binoei]XP_060116904.1 protein S100-A12-like [Heteronotia binoei]